MREAERVLMLSKAAQGVNGTLKGLDRPIAGELASGQLGWLRRNFKTFRARPGLALAFLKWRLVRATGFRAREAQMCTGLRWGGFSSLGDYLSQRNAPSLAIKQYLTIALPPGATVFDVGANLGSFSLYTLSCGLAPAEIYLFEPVPRTFARMQANFDRCRLQAHFERLAFGASHTGSVGMDFCQESPATASITTTTAELAAVTTPMTTIDRYLAERRIKNVDFLKLDVEGYEIDVLLGAETSARAGHIRSICVEVCPGNLTRFGRSTDELYDLLRSFGYRLALFDESSGQLQIDVTKASLHGIDLADLLCVHERTGPTLDDQT